MRARARVCVNAKRMLCRSSCWRFARAAARPAGERGPVTAGKPIKVPLALKFNLMVDYSEPKASYPPVPPSSPAVGLLRGRVPHMLHHRHPVRGPHAHHRHVLLRVPML